MIGYHREHWNKQLSKGKDSALAREQLEILEREQRRILDLLFDSACNFTGE